MTKRTHFNTVVNANDSPVVDEEMKPMRRVKMLLDAMAEITTEAESLFAAATEKLEHARLIATEVKEAMAQIDLGN